MTVRIAFVSQPFDRLVPPEQNSLGIWTSNLAPRLAAHADVTVYGLRSRRQPVLPIADGVRGRTVPAGLDRFWTRLLAVAARRAGGTWPYFGSRAVRLSGD